MNYIIRDKSLITGKKNLEHLYTIKNCPVFMGCVATPPAEDLLVDMVWNICPDTGLIQLGKLIPLEILYQDQHNDGIGTVWQKHYQEFTDFIKKNNTGKNILEIGGAHDVIANLYFQDHPDVNWLSVEPNPQFIKNPKIKIIPTLFDENFKCQDKVDTIIHSHVFEHVYDPLKFIEQIGKFLEIGQKHIFSFPNFLPMLKNMQTNCLNFEHTVFLTEDFVLYILKRFGFKVVDKQYFGNPHSIFLATERVPADATLVQPLNRYTEYKQVFMDFINYHLALVAELNAKIKASSEPVYLFGAHIFSQYLISFGLETDKIKAVLDNSAIKIGKRLYGTQLQVLSPKSLAGQGKVNVILKAGIYNEEIKKDILENINQDVCFW